MFFFRKNTYLARKKFYLAFFDMCDPRHMYPVTKHDEKLFAEGLDPCKRSSTFWLQCDVFWNSSYMRNYMENSNLPISCVA